MCIRDRHGSYSAQTAIRTLLAGSGLTLVQQGSSYVIRPLTTEAETILIPETRVQGELAYHPATDVMSAPQYITAEEIRQRNTGDGNVTELLRTNPAVQFAGNDSSSLNQGEIKPSRISIHGASSFQNAYKLDGISFNNDFDPAKDTLGETSTRLDSGDQGMYIDSRLIDSVTVYDNNIPVEFGGFTGGSVDVTSRRWNGENSGQCITAPPAPPGIICLRIPHSRLIHQKMISVTRPVSRMNITNTISAAGLKSV